MKQIKYSDEQEWLDARRGRITGTRAGSMFSKRDGKPLRGFYEVIAERIAIPRDDENRMERGKRLEVEAIERFEAETGKKVNKDLILCVRDDNEHIAYSPDGLIGKTEDVEVKCLSSAAHIEAYITKEVPDEYVPQIIQGFVVNDSLKRRYMVFYDPTMPKDFFYLTIERKDYEEDVSTYLNLQRRALETIEEMVADLTF